MKPPLVGIFQRSGQGRHDFPAISQVTSNLGPFLVFTDLIETAPNFNGLFELVKVEWSLVDTWKTVQICAILSMEFGKLIEVVEIRSSTCSVFSMSSHHVRYEYRLTSFD